MDVRRRSILSETLHEGGSGEDSNYLTIEALEDGLTASLSVNACEYCVDGDGNWKSLTAGIATESINSGHTLSFRGEVTPNSSNGIGRFTINKKCNLKGNCMSMLFGDSAVDNFSLSGKNYAFYKLFYNCSNIVNVSSNFLPATTLAHGCYSYMFQKCSSLTTAPELPATTLANSCYQFMFQNCTSLTTAPTLPATTLESSCYYYMFYKCTKLNYIKMLATNISASNCLSSWLYNVASTGTFVKNPAMTTLPTGESGIPEGWTVVNDGEESGGNLITFTINGKEYQAEEGMTWAEWVDSDYNTLGYYITNNIVRPGSSLELVNASNTLQYATTIILNNAIYRVTGGGAAD